MVNRSVADIIRAAKASVDDAIGSAYQAGWAGASELASGEEWERLETASYRSSERVDAMLTLLPDLAALVEAVDAVLVADDSEDEEQVWKALLWLRVTRAALNAKATEMEAKCADRREA